MPNDDIYDYYTDVRFFDLGDARRLRDYRHRYPLWVDDNAMVHYLEEKEDIQKLLIGRWAITSEWREDALEGWWTFASTRWKGGDTGIPEEARIWGRRSLLETSITQCVHQHAVRQAVGAVPLAYVVAEASHGYGDRRWPIKYDDGHPSALEAMRRFLLQCHALRPTFNREQEDGD